MLAPSLLPKLANREHANRAAITMSSCADGAAVLSVARVRATAVVPTCCAEQEMSRLEGFVPGMHIADHAKLATVSKGVMTMC